MEIRKLKQKELKLLKNALKFFGAESLAERYVFFIVEDERKNLHMCTPEIFQLINGVSGINLRWAGIKVGEMGSRRVRFTLEGAYHIGGRRKRVFVSERGEMLFLYGRDVFASSVVGLDRDVEENDVVFVVNRDGDVLGLGKMRYPPERIKHLDKGTVAVQNLVDRGEYLRRMRLYDAF